MKQSKRIAIYPGSFNPFTIGHLNILQKAEAIFGKENVIIAVGINPEKVKTISTPGIIGSTAISIVEIDRVETIKGNMPSRNVEKFSGFLTDYVWEKEKDGYDVTIIKGLRNGDDLDYEVNQLRFMEEMKEQVKVIFLVCDKQYEHVSSSAYRALETIRSGAGHRYLAKEYEESKISAKMIESSECVIIVNKDATDIMEKYVIIQKAKVLNDAFDFSGTYIECLDWIKEQEKK